MAFEPLIIDYQDLSVFLFPLAVFLGNGWQDFRFGLCPRLMPAILKSAHADGLDLVRAPDTGTELAKSEVE